MVETIRALCKQEGISIKALERELGFGNGTISRWDENTPSIGKVSAVADYFDTTVDYLLRHTDGPENRGRFGTVPPEFWASGASGQKEKPIPVSGCGLMYAPGYELLTPENRAKANSYLAFLLAEQQRNQT